VSDENNPDYMAQRLDATLVNPWGIAVNPKGPIWIASESSGMSQVYDKDGGQIIPAVTIPGNDPKLPGHPSGIVFNGTTDFVIPGTTTPARFIYVGTDGVLSAWAGGTIGTVIMDNGPTSIYTGLTLDSVGDKHYLYAANLALGRIDVWDKDFNPVNKSFTDPSLPAGYAPFNLRIINNLLYVAYAEVDPATHEEEHAPGLGLIDVFTHDGNFIKRFTSFGTLNAPWGLAASTPGSCDIDDAILVGNFGDGHINVFNALGKYKGQLMSMGKPLAIDGLWALETKVPGADSSRIYFTAGIDDEQHGLFGYIIRK